MTDDADGCARRYGASQVDCISAPAPKLILGLVEQLIDSVSFSPPPSLKEEKA